jgi:hypothetical protein
MEKLFIGWGAADNRTIDLPSSAHTDKFVQVLYGSACHK